MIATLYLLYFTFAFWAEGNTKLSVRPVIKLFYKVLLARSEEPMIFIFAFEANLSITCWAFNFFGIKVLSLNISFTTWLHTKSY